MVEVHGVEADVFADEVLELAGGDFAVSGDLHAFRDLPEPEERLDQLAFTTNGHLGKSLELFPVRDFGSGFQPGRKEFKLGDGNFPLVPREAIDVRAVLWGRRGGEF